MPTKSRINPTAIWGDGWWSVGEIYSCMSSSIVHPPPPNVAMEGIEAITYENSNRSQPNPCVQTINWKATKAYLADGFTPGGLPDWGYTFKTFNPLVADVHHHGYLHRMPNSPWSVPRSELLEADPRLDMMLADAVARIETGCREPIFALPRAVAELRDVPQTLKGAVKLLDWWGQMNKAIPKGIRGIAPKELRNASPTRVAAWFAGKTVGEVASAYLGVVFGIKPTASDINTFMGNPTNARKSMKLAVTQPKLYRGQKLEAAFKVGPAQSSFPTLESVSLNYNVGLMVNFNSPNGIVERLGPKQRGNAYRVPTHSGVAFGEVVGEPIRGDWTYGEQLALSGGGLGSTAWALTPFTWLSDSVYDLGKTIAQIERAGLPLELRPSLRFGTWISHKECTSTYLPRYQMLPYSYSYRPPSEGGDGLVHCLGGMVPRGYEVAFEGDLTYSRYQLTGRFNTVGMPTIRAPGGYTLGPLAAICAQFAANKRLK